MTVTSYAVGSEFKIVDGFTAPLEKLIAGVKDADALIKKAATSAGQIGVAFDKSVTKATAALGLLNDEALKKATAFQGIYDKAFASLGVGASAASKDVLAQFSAMEKGVAAQFDAIKGSSAGLFAGMGEGAEAGATGVLTALGRIDSAVAASVANLAALKRGLANMGDVAALPSAGGGGTRLPGSGPFGRAKHGSGGGAHFGRVGSELPGGTHFSIGGNGLLAAAGIFGYGVYEEAEIQDQVARIMATSQLPFGKDMMNSPQAKLIREAIQNGAAATGFSAKEVGESFLGTEREFQGLDFEKRMEVLKTLMPFAGAEARLKETGLKESFETLVGLMHMSGGFKPEDLPELARSFSFASMATPSSLPQFANALSYPMTTLHEGLGMDPSTVMFLTSMMQTAGIKSTKSGTWLRSFFQGAEADTPALGPLKNSQIQHNEALRKLGLIDGENHGTWQKAGADGKTDWMASVINLSEILNKNLHNLPTDDRLEMIKKAFGQQGGGFATLMEMSSFIEQMPVIAGKMKSFKGGDDVLEMLGQGSTVQQAREAWRDTQNLLMDIGKTALPAVNSALKDFDGAIKGITDSPAFKLFVKATDSGTDPIAAAASAARKAVTDGIDGLLHGAKPQSRDEINREMQNKLYHPSAFTTFDDIGGSSAMSDAVADGFLKAFRQIQGIDVGGSASGGGFTNAAYTTWSDGPGGGGSLPSIRRGRPHSYGPGPSTAGAGRGGDDPALTARARESWDFWKSKGLGDGAAAGLLGMEHGENNFYANGGMFGGWGDQGAAYGSFMWHKDRRARIFAGTGINVIGASHQKQLEAAYWEMMHGEAGSHFLDHLQGLGPAAAAALGVNGFERPLDRRGASQLRGAYAEQWFRRFHGVGKPPSRRPAPSASDIVADARQPDVHIHIDGKKLAHVVGRQMASAATYAHSIGGRDTHAYWPAPGDTLTDAG